MHKTAFHRSVQALHDLAPSTFDRLRAIGMPERIWRHLYFRGEISIEVSRDVRFRMRHGGHRVENDLYWNGFGRGWEGSSLCLWRRLAPSATTIFDIGANTGVYALVAKALNPSARVYAFEPVARVCRRLEENILINDWDIDAVEAAVSDANGIATLYDTVGDHQYSASLEVGMLAERSGIVRTQVETIRLIDFMEERREDRIDLIKIDTERHEREVLRGMASLISSKQPTFLIEVLDRSLGRAVEMYFPQESFRYYEIHEGQGAFRVDMLGGGERNYLICPHLVAESQGFGGGIRHEDL